MDTLVIAGLVIGVLGFFVSVRSFVNRRRPRRPMLTFDEAFKSLLLKWHLEGKADMSRFWNLPRGQHRAILFRIIANDDERGLLLPVGFINETQDLVVRYWDRQTRECFDRPVDFTVASGRTKAECDEEVRLWEGAFELANMAYD